MSNLSPRDRELVALGAAMGSNCVPCIEYHVPESRKAGLTDEDIRAAIQHADRVRQVPARKTLEAALNQLPPAPGEKAAEEARPGGGCGTPGPAGVAGADDTARSMDAMAGMMSRMMATRCGGSHSAPGPKTPEERAAVSPAAGEGCGCA